MGRDGGRKVGRKACRRWECSREVGDYSRGRGVVREGGRKK